MSDTTERSFLRFFVEDFHVHASCIGLLLATLLAAPVQETLPPLVDERPPETVEAMWDGFDPRAEPLEVEVLREWEEDGVRLKVLRYRVGVFKGKKAMMAAVYGAPIGQQNLPGLVQIHGGGQYADFKAPLTNAKRGYATISIAWAGRIAAPDYVVSPAVVKLFWDNKIEHPQYRVTTEWGDVDGYHAPSRNLGNQFPSVTPAAWTLDPVPSPRNSPWFLCTLAARRALTFLEQQPEVDGSRLGVYGHSMGGKLTVMTARSDDRVKAAAPSCGGISDRSNASTLYEETIADDAFLKRLSCPIFFLSPANDFHGRINDLQTALDEIKSADWRVTCSPHHNHQDTAEYEVASQLWFDQILKGTRHLPKTPGFSLQLETATGIPACVVQPDASLPIQSVDVLFTRQGDPAGGDAINRFWHHVPAAETAHGWTATLPLSDVDQPLWVYANVRYELPEPVTTAGYYYRVSTTKQFVLSSRMEMRSANDLATAGVQATRPPSLVIETFGPGWEHEWFTYRPEKWGCSTHKIHDRFYKAPAGSHLAFSVQSASPNKLVVGLDAYATEITLTGGAAFQPVTLSPEDFQNAQGEPLNSWQGLKELRLGEQETLKATVNGKQTVKELGAAWQGEEPVFNTMRWER